MCKPDPNPSESSTIFSTLCQTWDPTNDKNPNNKVKSCCIFKMADLNNITVTTTSPDKASPQNTSHVWYVVEEGAPNGSQIDTLIDMGCPRTPSGEDGSKVCAGGTPAFSLTSCEDPLHPTICKGKYTPPPREPSQATGNVVRQTPVTH